MSGPVSTGMGYHLRMGKPPPYATIHQGQLSLLPYAGREMSTSQCAVMLCSWGVKAGWLISYVNKRGWHVKLCASPLTRATLEMTVTYTIKHCIKYVLFTLLTGTSFYLNRFKSKKI